jgi:hypothetical protein
MASLPGQVCSPAPLRYGEIMDCRCYLCIPRRGYLRERCLHALG